MDRAFARQLNVRAALWLGCLICILAAEGIAVTRSDLWAAPLICVLIIALATDLPIVPFLGTILFIRILTDSSLASTANRHTGSVNLSGGIAALFIMVAFGLVIHRRKGLWPACLTAFFLFVWTIIAISTHGASTVTIREGVREASLVALAIIVYNSRGALSVPVVTRLIQIVGTVSAIVAIYQFATHTGVDISGKIRSNGTFSHPDGASMYFAIAATASVWRYLDDGRRRSDMIFAGLFGAATIATFSIGGVASLLVMLMAFGSLRPGAFRIKLASYAVAGLIVVGLLATPLGSERLASESSTNLGSAVTRRTAENTSLGWRLYKWQTLLPEWERAPFFGQGLGTTITVEGTSQNGTTAKVPHNEYVRYLVETGVVGLAIMLGAIFMIVRGLARRRKIHGTLNAGAFGLAIFLGCLFNALGDNTFLYSTTGYAAALIIAAVFCITNEPTARQTLGGQVRS
jgi:O-antigen ligase